MQSTITVGDTLNFVSSVAAYPKLVDYPATAGWTLTHKLMPRVSGTVLSFNATAEGADYRSIVLAATTAAWDAGFYSWAAYVTKAAERYTVAQGETVIVGDPANTNALDGRTHSRKTLDAIEAVIEGRATKDQMAYTIGTRSLQRMPIKDLLLFRAQYRLEVQNEERAASGYRGGRLLARL